MTALKGIINANKITQSELAIMNYVEKYNIPSTFHFYTEPLMGGIGFLMHIDNEAIIVPERYQVDPTLQGVLIGLGIASNIDNEILKILNDIRLIIKDGVYMYDPTLVGHVSKNGIDDLSKIMYGKANLSAVKELSYFTHGSQITAIQKKSDIISIGFPIFDYDAQNVIIDKIESSCLQLREHNIKDNIIIKTISNPYNKDKTYQYICQCLNIFNKLGLSVARIMFSYVDNHDICEIYFISE